ncbi:MAG: thiamine phosphate synthase [Methanocorpusculum sp.]|nr:thiamine phosphate synthase [Methanocorpusculum sp.]
MKLNLYVVTDNKLSNGKSHEEITKEAVAGGADVIQLRDKEMSSAELFQTAVRMREICKGKAMFIVNDRLDIALASKANGVHLGQDDLPLNEARRLVPKNFIIGLSVGSLEEAVRGAADGADYIAVSPVFSTDSKADAGEGHGIALIEEIKKALPEIPLIAIGGINENNAGELINAGLDGVAVISAVVSQQNIKKAAERLSKIISEAKYERRS